MEVLMLKTSIPVKHVSTDKFHTFWKNVKGNVTMISIQSCGNKANDFSLQIILDLLLLFPKNQMIDRSSQSDLKIMFTG